MPGADALKEAKVEEQGVVFYLRSWAQRLVSTLRERSEEEPR